MIILIHINDLLPDDRYLLDESNIPRFFHCRRRHHIWLGKFFQAIKAAGAVEDKNKEWSDRIIDNQHEVLIGTRLISSTADDAALSTKLVSEYDNVRVIFDEEVYRIEKCGLDSKEKSDIIDDPDDSVFIVDNVMPEVN